MTYRKYELSCQYCLYAEKQENGWRCRLSACCCAQERRRAGYAEKEIYPNGNQNQPGNP